MGSEYRLIVCPINITGIEELVLSGMVHHDGMLVFPKDRAIKYLDSYNVKYHIEKENDDDCCGLNPERIVWGFFKMDDDIPDWEEVHDKVNYKMTWNLQSPMLITYESYPIYDDFQYGVFTRPTEISVIDTMLETHKREITVSFIDEYINQLRKYTGIDDIQNFTGSIDFLKEHIGSYLHIGY